MRQSTFTPWSYFKAKSIFLFAKRTGNGSVAGSGLRQIGTLSPAIQRGSDGRPGPVLQSLLTALAALGPRWELGYNTVPGAGNEASLFRGGLRGKVFTYFIYNPGSVQLLNTAHSPVLQPMLRRHALCGPRLGWAGAGRNEHAVVPVRDLPLEEVAVPVTHPEAASFLWRPAVLIAVRQVTRPPFQVETPQCATLHSTWSTVSRTPSPGAYGQKMGVNYSEIPCRHPHKNGSICPLPNTTSMKLWVQGDNIIWPLRVWRLDQFAFVEIPTASLTSEVNLDELIPLSEPWCP